ncbi:MAG: hypothetical protein A2161_07070 [Candidatus Schekmanbacteria bacterium RBG_13_48_7]|uniref:ATPase subunit I n=1 Tax=Candidatus Schekmanbacteria bacterium RBG_13_48_7 TaxID=1817878 RepID=A0A1F7RQC8_9BACT|nr:MAG: hypothetical protein A2161_07070 [Candidatus Schekmanbacteria bacterium RBG_13_48_7]
MIEINYSLILQIICVIFLYFILTKFLFSPILKILEERRSLIEGKREKATEISKENQEKEKSVLDSLEKCKKDMSSSLQEKITETQKAYDNQFEAVVDEGQQKLIQVKSELDKDIKEITSKVELRSEPIYQLILNKLGVR